MKKLVAVVLAVYIVFMGTVVVGGFLQKQASEEQNGEETIQTSHPNPKPSSQTNQTFTISQVAKHNNSSSCWLIINAQVYDVTSFLSQHPGGASTILPHCGQEATKAFDTKDQSFGGGHSPSANSLLQAYLIGKLAQ